MKIFLKKIPIQKNLGLGKNVQTVLYVYQSKSRSCLEINIILFNHKKIKKNSTYHNCNFFVQPLLFCVDRKLIKLPIMF